MTTARRPPQAGLRFERCMRGRTTLLLLVLSVSVVVSHTSPQDPPTAPTALTLRGGAMVAAPGVGRTIACGGRCV